MLNKKKISVMKRIILNVEKVLFFILFLFFTFIAFDWIVLKGGSVLFGKHHEGLFFPEVWSFMRNIFTWVNDGIVRNLMKILAIGITVFIPIFLACATCIYYLWCDFLLGDMKKNKSSGVNMRNLCVNL